MYMHAIQRGSSVFVPEDIEPARQAGGGAWVAALRIVGQELDRLIPN